MLPKQALGEAKIDPLMEAFTAIALMAAANAIVLMSTNPWSTRPSIFVI